jgi:hypothetical protein
MELGGTHLEARAPGNVLAESWSLTGPAALSTESQSPVTEKVSWSTIATATLLQGLVNSGRGKQRANSE